MKTEVSDGSIKNFYNIRTDIIMSVQQHTVTKAMDLSKYIPPSEPLPIVGNLFRWCKDADITKRFYLVADVKTPLAQSNRLLPFERLTEYDFEIDFITFVWNEEDESFSKWEPITFRERWFRAELDDDHPQKFVPAGHASEFASDSAMGFLASQWLWKKPENVGGWCCSPPQSKA